MTIDPFEQFADSIVPPHVRNQRHRVDEREARKAARAAIPPMVKRGLEKEQIEKAKQLVRYRQWKAEVREGMTRGDYGIEIIDLLKHMRRPTQAGGMVDYVLNAKWLLKCSNDVRTTLLGYIDHAMVRHNIRNGYPPFMDALPGEPPTDFLIIRRHLTGV